MTNNIGFVGKYLSCLKEIKVSKLQNCRRKCANKANYVHWLPVPTRLSQSMHYYVGLWVR